MSININIAVKQMALLKQVSPITIKRILERYLKDKKNNALIDSCAIRDQHSVKKALEAHVRELSTI